MVFNRSCEGRLILDKGEKRLVIDYKATLLFRMFHILLRRIIFKKKDLAW